MKAKTLSTKNLVTLFDVTAMTIHNWKKGMKSAPPLPDDLTPAKVKRWAEKNGVAMTCDPSTLLGVGALKPGPKPKAVEAEEPRRGLTNAQAVRKGLLKNEPLSFGQILGVKESRTACADVPRTRSRHKTA